MYWCYCVEVWPALPALWPCFIKSIMVNHVLFNYTKGEFSPVQFLGFWLFAISPLSAIVNPLFCVISGGSFFNPGKYWTFAMSAVRKLSVVILRKAAMSAGQGRKACPFLGSLGSPSTMGWGQHAVKCLRGSETWSTGFLITKKPSDGFPILSLVKAKGISWLFRSWRLPSWNRA